jgi:hypothetical protein
MAARLGRQMLQQDRGQAASVVSVVDDERHLRIVATRDAVVLSHGHQITAAKGDEGEVVGATEVGGPNDVIVGRQGMGGEEPQPAALVRQSGVEGGDRRLILGANQANVGGGPIAQQDVESNLGLAGRLCRKRHRTAILRSLWTTNAPTAMARSDWPSGRFSPRPFRRIAMRSTPEACTAQPGHDKGRRSPGRFGR